MLEESVSFRLFQSEMGCWFLSFSKVSGQGASHLHDIRATMHDVRFICVFNFLFYVGSVLLRSIQGTTFGVLWSEETCCGIRRESADLLVRALHTGDRFFIIKFRISQASGLDRVALQ